MICPAGHETEQQHDRRVLGGQGALRLHAAPELLVEPFDRVLSASLRELT
jgi:hypothetical protein